MTSQLKQGKYCASNTGIQWKTNSNYKRLCLGCTSGNRKRRIKIKRKKDKKILNIEGYTIYKMKIRFLFQRSHHERYSYNECDYSSVNKQFVCIFLCACLRLCFVILKIYSTLRICSVLNYLINIISVY